MEKIKRKLQKELKQSSENIQSKDVQVKSQGSWVEIRKMNMHTFYNFFITFFQNFNMLQPDEK